MKIRNKVGSAPPPTPTTTPSSAIVFDQDSTIVVDPHHNSNHIDQDCEIFIKTIDKLILDRFGSLISLCVRFGQLGRLNYIISCD